MGTVNQFIQRRESRATYEWGHKHYHFAWDAITTPFCTPDDVEVPFYNAITNTIGGLIYKGTVLKTLEVSMIDDNHWLCTADFETMTIQEQEIALLPPLDRATVWSVDTREVTKDFLYDVDTGNAVVNSCGDAYTNQPVVRNGQTILILTKNVSTDFWTPSVPSQFEWYTNGNPMYGYGAKQLLCTKCTAPPMMNETINYQNYYYYQVTCEFEVDNTDLTWKMETVDAGLRQRDSEGNPVRIRDKDTQESITDPVALDGNGKALDDPNPEDLVYNQYTAYQAADFSVFGF